MLLDLPAELLLEVVHALDPASFTQVLRVCKLLRNIAIGTTPLQVQLSKVPGITNGLSGKDVYKLYKTFRTRSQTSLLHGLGAVADISRFTLPLSEQVKYGAFMNCSCKTDHLLMAVVHPSNASIGVHSIKSNFPILKCILSPTVLELGPEEDIEFEVLKTAFYDPHERMATCQCVDRLAVLYRYRLKSKGGGPLVDEAVRYSKETLKLVTWWFSGDFDASIADVRDITTGGLLEPKALAMAHDGSAVISYEHNLCTRPKSGKEWWRVEWIQKRPDRFYDPYPNVHAYETGSQCSDTPAPIEIAIKKRRAWFFIAGNPTPEWEMDDYSSGRSLHLSPAPVCLASRPFTADSFGLPLVTYHKHNLNDGWGEEFCLNSVLQLHFITDGPKPGAYIFKGIHFPDGCQDYNTSHRHFNLEQYTVAELGGLDFAAGKNSTLGFILAVSPSKQRIAVATWKRVQIWSFNANAFFERQKHTNKPWTSDISTAFDFTASTTNVPPSTSLNNHDDELDEWTWGERCGWDYYSCFPRRDISNGPESRSSSRGSPEIDSSVEIVSLQPVELPSEGVVFALVFAGEDKLWAWTDRGPVCWRIHADCDGRRGEWPLMREVKEMNIGA